MLARAIALGYPDQHEATRSFDASIPRGDPSDCVRCQSVFDVAGLRRTGDATPYIRFADELI
jgi:hypothetical protein